MKSMIDDMAHVDLEENEREMYYYHFLILLLIVIGLNPTTSIGHEMKFIIDDMAHVELEENEREMYYEDDGESVTGTICTRRNNRDENRFTGIDRKSTRLNSSHP